MCRLTAGAARSDNSTSWCSPGDIAALDAGAVEQNRARLEAMASWAKKPGRRLAKVRPHPILLLLGLNSNSNCNCKCSRGGFIRTID